MKGSAIAYSIKYITLLTVLNFSHSASTQATIIKMDLAIGNQSSNSIYFDLYDSVAPITVNNFISYVSSGDYINSLIHRSIPGFIVQGGGFTYNPNYDSDARFIDGQGNLAKSGDPVTGELGVRPIGETYYVDVNNDGVADVDSYGNVITRVNTGLNAITVRDPITNEFNLSNTRGTLAMATTYGDPDSATSQWFVNMTDNSGTLDTQNGGYTVFGQVLGNGMDVFDEINSLSLAPPLAAYIDPQFGSLPVVNYSPYTLILEKNIVRVTNVEVVNAVPIPPAIWLFSSGLLGLIQVARRKKL